MNARARTLALSAVVFGVLAAIVVALVVPTRSEGENAPAKRRPIVVLPRKSDKVSPSMLVLQPQRSSVRIAVRLSDPLGGPPFALRVFRAERLALYPSHPSLDHARLLGHDLCAQLGHIYHGQFGWLDAQRRFRPANFDYESGPLACGYRWRDARSTPQVRLTTLISDPAATTARTLESVAWGFGGRQTESVEIDGTPARSTALGPEGAFLVRIPLDVRKNELQARFRFRSRSDETIPFAYVAGTRDGGTRARVKPGTAVIEARAPDPGGGLAWGILGYRTTDGTYCVTQPGRIVGDRVGTVDFVHGTFDDIWDVGRQCGASLDRLPPGWPVAIGAEFGGGLTPQSEDPTSDPTAGRTALRILPGRTVIYGLARPNVKEVTIESPRDVRTLIPSPRAHSFIVVYDGTFPAGKLKLTATMADGSEKTVRQFAGF